MKKKALWIAAAVVVFALAWSFWPRPLLQNDAGEIFRVTVWVDPVDTDMTDQVDREALWTLLSETRCRFGGIRGDAFSLDEYPVEIGVQYPGVIGGRYIHAGPGGAFVYNSNEESWWRIYESEALWQELTELLPMEP